MYRRHLKDVCFKNKHIKKVLLEVLHNYKDLSLNDIQWCINIITSSCNITTENIAEFCLKLSTSKIIGKFSLTFHDNLIQYIKNKDSNNLIKLLTSERNILIPEIYDNALLTTDEVNQLENIYKKEYTSILDVLNIINSKIDIQNCILERIILTDEICTGYKDISLYDKCYNTVCVRTEELDTKYIEDVISFNIRKSDTEFEICYDLVELLKLIVSNRIKNIPIEVVKNTEDKYSLEIKFVKRYMKR